MDRPSQDVSICQSDGASARQRVLRAGSWKRVTHLPLLLCQPLHLTVLGFQGCLHLVVEGRVPGLTLGAERPQSLDSKILSCLEGLGAEPGGPSKNALGS